MVIAPVLDAIAVAGDDPAVAERRSSRFSAVVVADRGRAAAHPQRALGRVGAVHVDDAGLVAGDDATRGSWRHVLRSVRDRDVADLGRSDPVQDREAEALVPPCSERRRQRLAGGDAHADRRGVHRRAGLGGLEQRRVRGRHRVQDRRPFRGDEPPRALRRETFRIENDRSARRERDHHRVVQAVGKEELGRAVHAVVGSDMRDMAAVPLCRKEHAAMKVDDRLRRAGRAARVLPKAHVRLARRGRRDRARPVVEEAGVRVGDREGRTRVAKHEIELLGPRVGRQRHRDRAELGRAKKRGDEPG